MGPEQMRSNWPRRRFRYGRVLWSERHEPQAYRICVRDRSRLCQIPSAAGEWGRCLRIPIARRSRGCTAPRSHCPPTPSAPAGLPVSAPADRLPGKRTRGRTSSTGPLGPLHIALAH